MTVLTERMLAAVNTVPEYPRSSRHVNNASEAPSWDNRRTPIRCKHLAKKSRLPGCVLRVAKIAQNNADEAKTLTWVQANAFSKG